MNVQSQAQIDTASAEPSMRILILADLPTHNASTVSDHVLAFRKYSHHNVDVVQAAGRHWAADLSLDYYDVVVIHYSLCIIFDWYVKRDLARALAAFKGLKVQFIQDEYRWINQIVDQSLLLGVHVLYSVLPEKSAHVVYRRLIDTGVTILPTLTGYVSEDMLRYPSRPISERKLDVAYRGRDVPYWLGALGQEKAWIGEKFLDYGQKAALSCDIAWREQDRIYGKSWLDFNASARAVLGTESGASILDLDGEVHRRVDAYLVQHPKASFDDVSRDVLGPYEGHLDMAAISPRVFEAMALRTALIMFPGHYSGLFQPGRDYIEIKKDFSNFDDVVRKLKDTNALQEMVDRNYEEYIASGHFSFREFVERFDCEAVREWRLRCVDRGLQRLPLSKYPGNQVAKRVAALVGAERALNLTNRTRTALAKFKRYGHLLIGRGVSLCGRIIHKPREVVRRFRSLLSILRSNHRIRPLVRTILLAPGLGARSRARNLKRIYFIALMNKYIANGGSNIVLTIELADGRTITLPRSRRPSPRIRSVVVELETGLAEGRVRRLTWAKSDWSQADQMPSFFENGTWAWAPGGRFWMASANGLASLCLEYPPGFGPPTQVSNREQNLRKALERVNRRVQFATISQAFASIRASGNGGMKRWSMRRSWLIWPKPKKSVVFLHNSYYHFFFLAQELRRRGWDAVTVAFDPPDGGHAWLYHGCDINLYDENPEKRRANGAALLREVKRGYSALHFHGVNMMHMRDDQAENSPFVPVTPGDFLELKHSGVKIGYSLVGCNDGILQSTWNRWTGGMCSKCRFQRDPDACADARNLAWGHKLGMVADVIFAEMMPRLDFLKSENTITVPASYGVDHTMWRPDLEVPEKYRLPRRDGEIIVLHSVGYFDHRIKGDADPKGTKAVFAAVERLKAEGENVRLEFTQNLPSRDMKYIQVQADIVVDQLYFGRYGAFGRECLMLGRPVVGYLKYDPAEEDPETLECLQECPIVNATVDTVYDVLKELVRSPERRAEIGQQSRAFALDWHSVAACADRFEQYYAERLGIY